MAVLTLAVLILTVAVLTMAVHLLQAPIAVGDVVHLFLADAWARAVVSAVRPPTEKHAGTPLRRSVRHGRRCWLGW